MGRLVFLDIDDTLLMPPYHSIRLIARLLRIKNFPTEDQIQNRCEIDHYKAFPDVFKTKNAMWAMALASLPFGLVRCQKLFSELDIKKLRDILSDPRVFLVTRNPPFLSRLRIKHLEALTGAKLNGRYIACGPIFAKSQSKVNIIKAIAALHRVELSECLFVDDHPRDMAEAMDLGISCRLVDATWNKVDIKTIRTNHLKLCDDVIGFLGACRIAPPVSRLHFVFPRAGLFSFLNFRVLELFYKSFGLFPMALDTTRQAVSSSLIVGVIRAFRNGKSGETLGNLSAGTKLIIWTPFGFSVTMDGVDEGNNENSEKKTFSISLINEVYKAFGMTLENELFSNTEHYSKRELKQRIEVELKQKMLEKDGELFKKYTDEMLTSRSPLGSYIVYIFFSVVFKIVFRKIYVQKSTSLKKIEDDYFVVYAPHHRSIYDSAMLMKVLADEGCSMPITPAADKMKNNLVGFLGRFIGVFYIRRQKMTPLYYNLMAEVVKHALRFSASVGIFLEGQRSRSGLSLVPKAGVLKMLLAGSRQVSMKPIAIVPISFAYNKLPESDLLLNEVYNEIQGANNLTAQNQADMLVHRTSSRITFVNLFKLMVNKRVSDAYVTFGSPIFVKSNDADVNFYLKKVMIQKNCVVPPIATSIACAAILSSKANHLFVLDLVRFLNFSSLLIKLYPGGFYNNIVSNSGIDFDLELNDLPFVNRKFKSHKISQNDVISITDIDTIVASHYQNNILHYFAISATLAKLIQKTNSGQVADLYVVFEKVMIQVCDKFYIADFDRTSIFNKLIILFSMAGVIEVESGEYRYHVQQDSAPFSILCTIAEKINKIINKLDIFEISRKSERIIFSIPMKVKGNGIDALVPGKLINISRAGGACHAELSVKEQDLVQIYLGHANEQEFQSAIVVRTFESGFAFKYLQSDQSLPHPSSEEMIKISVA